MIYELKWDFDFFREFEYRLDIEKLYDIIENEWMKAANICYFSGIKLWNDRLNQIRELL